MDYAKGYKDYIEEIRNDAAISGTDANYEFVRRTFSLLEELNELQDTQQFFFGKPGKRGRIMQIDGYTFDEAENSLILLISDFVNSTDIELINNTQIDGLYNKMLYFLDELCNGNIADYCDDSDDTLKLAKLIKYRMNIDNTGEALLKIKFYILTNKKLSNSVKKLKQQDFNKKPVELNIWDIERIYDNENQKNNEPIIIDIAKDFGFEGVPCVKARIGENLGYEAYMAVISGELLSRIYIEYGSKVLEGNVRAFLGTNGNKSVNAGIKRTITDEPSKFFIYNNGIATTAASIEVKQKGDQLFITKVEDLQIINGGQTTASLANTLLNPPKGCTVEQIKNNIRNIYVPMKLTVISDRESTDELGVRTYDSMVQKISRYANTQNPVKAADFFSNSPFHVLMEKLSKQYLAPPMNGSAIPTGWYYERSRKKYEQEQIKMTESEKKRFKEKFPSKGQASQLVTKEMLAKCLYCVECKPHIVAKGNNWIMKDFGESINQQFQKDRSFVNEFYFKTSIAKVILFKTVDQMVSKAPWYNVGGYKLNIVPYTISKIISSIPAGYSVDWMKIWNKQVVYPSFIREIEKVSKMTNDFIQNSNGVIVTEYCKKEETWKKYKDIPYVLSEEFLYDLINSDIIKEQEVDAAKEIKAQTKINYEIEVYNIGSQNWKKYYEFGVSSKLLNAKELSILRVAVEMERTGRTPSSKQAEIIMQIKTKLEDEGFRI